MILHPDLPSVVEWLRAAKMTIAFAESCTGGRLAADLTTVPGSSDVVVGSAVCYQLRAKQKVLGLEDVNEVNVVSRMTAEKMAQAACDLYEADVGVGTTGLLDGEYRHAYWALYTPSRSDDGISELHYRHVEFPRKTARDLNREILLRDLFDTLSIMARRYRETR